MALEGFIWQVQSGTNRWREVEVSAVKEGKEGRQAGRQEGREEWWEGRKRRMVRGMAGRIGVKEVVAAAVEKGKEEKERRGENRLAARRGFSVLCS
jgi:hypothetical protein